MMMPATPTPHFVVAHAQFLLADLETTLDRPAHATRANQALMRHVRRGIAQVGLQLSVGHTAAQHQPDRWARQSVANSHHAQEGKLGDLWPLAPFLNDVLLPLICGQGRGNRLDRLRRGRIRPQPFALRLGSPSRPRWYRAGWPFTPHPRVVRYLGEI